MTKRREINSRRVTTRDIKNSETGHSFKMWLLLHQWAIMKQKNWFYQLRSIYHNDFVTNSYVESWDSSCEKSRVPVKIQCVPVQKKEGILNWKCLGLYVWRQLIWRQTPKLFITVY